MMIKDLGIPTDPLYHLCCVRGVLNIHDLPLGRSCRGDGLGYISILEYVWVL
jgi:hypothetical protein